MTTVRICCGSTTNVIRTEEAAPALVVVVSAAAVVVVIETFLAFAPVLFFDYDNDNDNDNNWAYDSEMTLAKLRLQVKRSSFMVDRLSSEAA